jgi:hypothetical protein
MPVFVAGYNKFCSNRLIYPSHPWMIEAGKTAVNEFGKAMSLPLE